MDRRSFIAAGAAGLLVPVVTASAAVAKAGRMQGARTPIRYFDYRHVTLRPSRFRDQMIGARDFFLALPDDDLLRGYRAEAGLPAPGKPMKGWCTDNCDGTFGQWLSGMARMSCALDDAALRAKAIHLFTEWERTLARRDPVTRWGTYGWEKLSCGLLDLALYADHKPALDRLAAVTRWASRSFDRSRSPATIEDRDGRRPKGTLEWYTLAENSLRAYQATGDPMFLEFADLWHYDEYWNRFLATSRPADVALRHSYSHVNTFSSVAMFHAVTGDPRYLAILRNAYDWVRETQAYASGAFGPGEWTLAADGSLGDALETRPDTAEVPCCSWAGFKLSRYLTGFTGEARYGDWVETLLHNAIGAALPIQPDGRAYYYADYRVGLGIKTYFWDEWPCCSGSYIQAIADYHNILYHYDAEGLYVSQTIPSEVKWTQAGTPVRLILDTRYPDEEESRLALTLATPTRFKLRIRVPSWCPDARFAVNGAMVAVAASPDTWATLDREWRDGDLVTVRLPMRPRIRSVDGRHPERVAVMYGPSMMVQDGRWSYPISGTAETVLAGMTRKTGDALVLTNPPGDRARQGGHAVGDLIPFHRLGERAPYRSHFDLDRGRIL